MTWSRPGLMDENYRRSDSAFVVKLVVGLANTFGITLAFEKVSVPSLGLTGRMASLELHMNIEERKMSPWRTDTTS